MNTFAVYNLRDDIFAHNVFAIQRDEDVFSDVYTNVIAVVYVEDASWQEEYRAPGLLHKPYMEIRGSVSSLFLDDRDQRLFPCGTKRLLLKDITYADIGTGECPDKPQKVVISYVLSSEELSQVCSMGLFAAANDMTVPANLIGNAIMIPVTIRYMGIYDTPVVGIEILDANNLYTCTRENGYYGIFGACERSAEIEAEKHVNFEFYPHIEYDNEVSAVYDDVLEETPEEVMQESEEPDDEFEVAEDQATRSDVQNIVKQHIAEVEVHRRETEAHEDSRRAIVDRVQDYLNKRQRERSNEREATLSDAIFGVEGEDTREVEKEKAVYKDFKEAILEEDRKKSEAKEIARRVDIAMDNRVLNDGGGDISGFGAVSESTEESRIVDRAKDNMLLNNGIDDISGMASDSDALKSEILREKADQKSGKAQLKAARMADIAADNKALNEGNTDIAGQGVSESSKDKQLSSRDLVDSLLGENAIPVSSTPSDDGPQYL